MSKAVDTALDAAKTGKAVAAAAGNAAAGNVPGAVVELVKNAPAIGKTIVKALAIAMSLIMILFIGIEMLIAFILGGGSTKEEKMRKHFLSTKSAIGLRLDTGHEQSMNEALDKIYDFMPDFSVVLYKHLINESGPRTRMYYQSDIDRRENIKRNVEQRVREYVTTNNPYEFNRYMTELGYSKLNAYKTLSADANFKDNIEPYKDGTNDILAEITNKQMYPISFTRVDTEVEDDVPVRTYRFTNGPQKITYEIEGAGEVYVPRLMAIQQARIALNRREAFDNVYHDAEKEIHKLVSNGDKKGLKKYLVKIGYIDPELDETEQVIKSNNIFLMLESDTTFVDGVKPYSSETEALLAEVTESVKEDFDNDSLEIVDDIEKDEGMKPEDEEYEEPNIFEVFISGIKGTIDNAVVTPISNAIKGASFSKALDKAIERGDIFKYDCQQKNNSLFISMKTPTDEDWIKAFDLVEDEEDVNSPDYQYIADLINDMQGVIEAELSELGLSLSEMTLDMSQIVDMNIFQYYGGFLELHGQEGSSIEYGEVDRLRLERDSDGKYIEKINDGLILLNKKDIKGEYQSRAVDLPTFPQSREKPNGLPYFIGEEGLDSGFLVMVDHVFIEEIDMRPKYLNYDTGKVTIKYNVHKELFEQYYGFPISVIVGEQSEEDKDSIFQELYVEYELEDITDDANYLFEEEGGLAPYNYIIELGRWITGDNTRDDEGISISDTKFNVETIKKKDEDDEVKVKLETKISNVNSEETSYPIQLFNGQNVIWSDLITLNPNETKKIVFDNFKVEDGESFKIVVRLPFGESVSESIEFDGDERQDEGDDGVQAVITSTHGEGGILREKFVDNLPSHLTIKTRANGEYFNPRLLFMSRNNKVTDWSNKLDYKLIWNVPKGY